MSIPLLFAKRRFNPRRLFANGEQGVWYDPSDFSTMFQDSAGTTPVTAIEQPVGRILDKSGRGNHASQSTTTSRPILRNLYNLLTYTEQFDNAAWNKINLNVSSDTAATTDPLGGNTADKLVSTGANGSAHQVTTPFVAFGNNVQIVNLNNGTLGSLLSGSFNSFTVTSANDDWWLISAVKSGYAFSVYVKKGELGYAAIQLYDNTLGESRVYVYPAQSNSNIGTGDGTSGIYIWGASLVPENQSNLPYQRVVTNTLGSGVYDTDATRFPVYLRADRTDDSYTTADGGGGTIGFFYCASILLQAAGQTHTLISDTGTNAGYRVRINSSNRLELSAGNGSAYTTATTTETLSAGRMAVITAWHDGTKLYAQINNGAIAEQAFGTATAGTSGLTIGKDNGSASNYFGGGIYYHVYRKDKAPTDLERSKTKALCAAKGGITL